eukprot:scpid62784/ scgid29722/ 
MDFSPRILLVQLASALMLLTLREAEAICRPVSPCKCQDEETGKYIDLTGLANTDGEAAFTTTENSGQLINTFEYNPCLSFSTNSSSCSDVALCELNGLTGDQYALGYQQGAEFTVFPGNPEQLAVRYKYESSTSPREAYVALTCNPDVRVPLFSYISEGPPGTFYFNLTSACACPGGCADAPMRCDELLGGRNCSCALRNTSGEFLGLVDILSLNDPYNPLGVNVNNNQHIHFNPCSDMEHVRFFPNQCNGMTVCLANGDRAIDYGRGFTGKFTGNLQADAVLMYTSADGNRSTEITLVCDQDQRHSPRLILAAPVTDAMIQLEMRTVCACPGGCEQPQVTCQPQSDDCTCKLSQDLGSFTLSDLNNPEAPLHAVGPDLIDYYYNPCSNMSITGPNGFCRNVSGCKVNHPSNTDYAMGVQSGVSFRVSNYDPNIVTLMYTGGSQSKTFQVEARCNRNPDELVFRFLRAVPSSTAENAVYYFYLESDHVCPRP